MDFKKIEEKWQKKWEEAKLFEANPDERKKYFITFPYPYVNGAPHIGHSYSSMRTDAYARYKRMQGYNVLFPQAFHATGEPILGVVERLRNNNETQINALKMSGATDSEIEKFKHDPKYLVNFWVKRWIEDMKLGGYSIDWRRTFVTTTITPTYSRFIEWQYNTLKKNGYITQGTHPVVWCPNCKSPTGDHDRLSGEGESPIDYTLIKFKYNDSFIVAATLRPETLYGVTNIWINPASEYAIAKVDNEKWIVSKYAVDKLKDQLKSVEIIEEIDAEELIGKECLDMLSNRKLKILPSDFVKPDNATGIVMSVPSHAPYDWIAIKELIESDKLEQYGVTKDELEPIVLIESKDFKNTPAVEITEQMGIKSLNEVEKLDKATSILYKKEFHNGILKNCGEYSGMKVSEVKDKLIEDFKKRGIADTMWETTNAVICRCNTKCHVKILENQWFLKFSDENWKNKARECLDTMTLYPSEVKQNLENTFSWLKDKACARKTGLGTPIPWDKKWIVETLGDSTIYMAYYTIANAIAENNITADDLTDDAFDYLFLGKPLTNNPKKQILEKMKKEFEYWYPVDMRNSGKDLVQNHLAFYIFHHTAIWEKDKWPKAISVNGFVTVEGEKMSKSKGNFIPLRDILEEFGADMVRINIISANEGLEDADWRAENIKTFRAKYEFLMSVLDNLNSAKKKTKDFREIALISKLQKNIKNSTKMYEELKFRSGIVYSFFEPLNDIRFYINLNNGIENCNPETLRNFLEALIKLVSPFTPHICEELWEKLGNKGFVSVAEWPKADETLINEEAEAMENLAKRTVEDINQIKKIVGRQPEKINIYVAYKWKYKILEIAQRSPDDLIKEIMNYEEIKTAGKSAVKFVQALMKKQAKPDYLIAQEQEFETLALIKDFLSNEFKCPVEVVKAEDSDSEKSEKAEPGKPGIEIF